MQHSSLNSLTGRPSHTIFKISPQHFISNQLKIGVERFNASHSRSFVLCLNGTLGNNDHEYYDYRNYNGFGGELQYRKYLCPFKIYKTRNGREFYQGIYFAGFAQGGHYAGNLREQHYSYDPVTQNYTVQTYDYKDDVGNWAAGFTFGVQRTLWQTLFIEAFIGGGLQFSDRILSGQVPGYTYYYSPGITDYAYKGVLPKAGLQLGIGL